MTVNNEVGTIQPVAEIGAMVRAHGALFHTDAAQATGRIAIDVQKACVDLASLSAHKLYGPKGVGALYVRRLPTPVALKSQQSGGAQEGGLRSGTHNVPGIVGFGRAAEIAIEDLGTSSACVGALRDRLLAEIERGLGPVRVHGSRSARVAGNLSLTIDGVRGEQLLAALPSLAMSAGSACMSNGKGKPSAVLTAMGVPESAARDALRIGLGRFNTEDEVAQAASLIVETALRLRHRTRTR
jgi:cysteine desulfurase